MPAGYEHEAHIKELERKDFMRLNGLDDGESDHQLGQDYRVETKSGRNV